MGISERYFDKIYDGIVLRGVRSDTRPTRRFYEPS